MNDTDRAIAEIRAALDLVPARSWWSVPFGDHAKYIEACSPPNLRALLDRLDERDAEVERLRGELNDCIGALPGSACYMDPPDGGDVPVLEQLRRMAKDAARYRRGCARTMNTIIKIALLAAFALGYNVGRTQTATQTPDQPAAPDLHSSECCYRAGHCAR